MSLTANTWHVEKVVASEADAIRRTEFVASVATPFHLSFYDWEIGTLDLPTNPFASDETWKVPPPGYIVGWGQLGERMGFSPDGLESEGDAVTGRFIDETTWTYGHDRFETEAGYPD